MRKSLGARRWGERPDRLLKAKRFDHGEPIARIDTRPMAFVFAFLVMLIATAAPPTTHALTIDLGYWTYLEDGIESYPVPTIDVVSVSHRGQTIVNGNHMSPNELSLWLESLERRPQTPSVVFEPAPDSRYEDTLRVLAILENERSKNWFDLCLGSLTEHRSFSKSVSAFPVLLSIALPNPHFVKRCGGSPFIYVD